MGNDSTRNADLLEPLSIALKLEQEGREFFRQAAEKFESELAKQTFEFLAGEEDKHIERIEEYYHSIEQTGETGLPRLRKEATQERLNEFESRMALLRDGIKPTASDIDAYEYALKFENGAEEFYAKCLAESSDPHIKSFYKWIIQEEEVHSRILESCLLFARDPAAWFKERDLLKS